MAHAVGRYLPALGGQRCHEQCREGPPAPLCQRENVRDVCGGIPPPPPPSLLIKSETGGGSRLSDICRLGGEAEAARGMERVRKEEQEKEEVAERAHAETRSGG